jgi:hypothetical protein
MVVIEIAFSYLFFVFIVCKCLKFTGRNNE